MNNGYSSEAKIIKLEVSEEEYARVLEASLPGVTNEMYFKRTMSLFFLHIFVGNFDW